MARESECERNVCSSTGSEGIRVCATVLQGRVCQLCMAKRQRG